MCGMKLRCSFLALALLLGTYHAASAQDMAIGHIRQQAAQGWHQTYEAYGRTITVDIPIQVPDANRFAVLFATYMPHLAEPVVSDGDSVALFQGIGFFRLDSCVSQTGRATNPLPGGIGIQPVYLENNHLDPDTAYAYNNPSTVRDAQVMVELVWTENFAQEQVKFSPHAVYATCEACSNTDALSGTPRPCQGILMVYFHQMIDSIPVLCRGESGFRQLSTAPVREQAKSLGAMASLQKTPDDDSMFYSAQLQYTLVKPEGVLADDLPLCGLDTVIQSYEQLIERGLLRQISSLRLGYVAWQISEGSFALIPTWVLTGDLYADAQTPTRAIRLNQDPRIQEHGVILANARTGALIDPASVDIESLYK